MDATYVRCPICRKPVAFNDPYLPFCSDRCRLIDLGNWASEKYRVPAPPTDEDTDHVPDSEEFPEGPGR